MNNDIFLKDCPRDFRNEFKNTLARIDACKLSELNYKGGVARGMAQIISSGAQVSDDAVIELCGAILEYVALVEEYIGG